MQKKTILDANAILRYVLDDVKEQADIVENALKTKEVLILPEVLAEVIYVMTKYYNLPNDTTAEYICAFLDDAGCVSDLLINAVKLFGKENIDFVDCLLSEHSTDYEILTFDKKLLKLIKRTNDQ